MQDPEAFESHPPSQNHFSSSGKYCHQLPLLRCIGRRRFAPAVREGVRSSLVDDERGLAQQPEEGCQDKREDKNSLPGVHRTH